MARGIYADDSSDGRSNGRPGDFGDWLKLLPEAIDAVQARTGEPLVVVLPAVPESHAARLLATLGVEWTVSVAAAERVTRAERLAQINGLMAEGLSHQEVADRLGVSRSTVRNVRCDPDGTKQAKRRARYQGVCQGCGAPTDGSNGFKGQPEFCKDCYPAEAAKWTRDAIIDAIQRFAKAHGRPPTATEWMRSDPENDYPGATSCYRGSTRSSAPFAKWADAIEAAGFLRPRPGGYDRSDTRHRGRQPLERKAQVGNHLREFVILERNGNGWIEHDPVEAVSESLAVEFFADLAEKAEGDYVAVPVSRWTIRRLEPVTTVKAVAVTAEATPGE